MTAARRTVDTVVPVHRLVPEDRAREYVLRVASRQARFTGPHGGKYRAEGPPVYVGTVTAEDAEARGLPRRANGVYHLAQQDVRYVRPRR